MGSSGIMSVFNVILLLYGLYSIYSGRQMKATGEPVQWLMTMDEIKKARHPAEFCEYMAPKSIIFGVVCVLYGAFAIATDMIWKTNRLEYVSLVVFAVCIGWFYVTLRKAKKKYI